MSLSSRFNIFRGATWALAGKIISVICAFLLNVVLARYLAHSDYAAYFIALNTIIIAGTFAGLGLDQIIVRYIASQDDAYSDNATSTISGFFYIVVAASAFVSIFFFIFLKNIFNIAFHINISDSSLWAISLWIFFASIQRQVAETFRGLNNIKFATFFGGLRNNGIFISFLSGLLMFVAAKWFKLDITLAFFVSACSSAFTAGVALMSLPLSIKRKILMGQISMDSSLRYEFREGLFLWVASISTVLRLQGSAWLAGMADLPDKVALFAVAQRFVFLLTTPLMIVNALLPPIIASLYAKNKIEEIQKVTQGIGAVAAAPCFLLFLILLVAGRPIMEMVFGLFYGDAYFILITLAIGQIFNIITGSWQIILPMTGRNIDSLKINVASAVMQLFLCYLGGRLFGVEGVAIGFCCGAIFSNIWGLLIVWRKMNILTFVSFRREVLMEIIPLMREKKTKKNR